MRVRGGEPTQPGQIGRRMVIAPPNAAKDHGMTPLPSFQPGDIVELSERGRRNARSPGRRGVVVSIISRTRINVHWNGLTGPQALHCSLLQLVEAAMKSESYRGNRG